MRDYGKISPKFWTGETGRAIRMLGRDEQVIALYLPTCPSSNMIGLFYMPLPVLSHESGIPFKGASKALRRVIQTGYCFYNFETECVWIPEMAKHQIGETLKIGDKRHKAVLREWDAMKKSGFYVAFHERYGTPFNLPQPSPFEAPSKPLRSQEQEQEQEQEQKQEQEVGQAPATPGKKFQAPSVEEVAAYCESRRDKGNRVNPEKFTAYYAKQGWKLSNGLPMSDWKQAVLTWEHKDAERGAGVGSSGSNLFDGLNQSRARRLGHAND